METIRGKVVYQIFKAPDGYTVLDVKTKEGYLTVVGFFDEIALDTEYIFKGEWKTSKKYGPYFFAKTHEITIPDSEAGLITFLTGFIKGLGYKKAQMLVKKFGSKRLLEILDYEPEKLKEVPGIGDKTLQMIKSSWEVYRFSGKALSYLTELGITPKMALKIYKQYGEKTEAILEENPYILTEIWGIGFKKADYLARKIGVAPDDPRRIRAAILYVLQQAGDEGHTYLPQEEFLLRINDIEITNISLVETIAEELSSEGKIFLNDGVIAHGAFYTMASYILDRLVLYSQKNSNVEIHDYERIKKEILEETQRKMGVSLSERQLNAALLPYFYDFSLITGYAGTGKSLISRVILNLWDKLGLRYEICAPTGKAAKRLSELTGRKARTIHRLLKFNGEKYEYNSSNPLDVDAVLVDEVSMVSMPLFYRLLNALPLHARVVLVGDPAQLPSIGPGNILQDLLSMRFPNVTLTEVYRQGEGSTIALNAKYVREGKIPQITDSPDFIINYFENDNLYIDRIKETLLQYGTSIQLITPQKRGILGTKNLNFIAQQILNPPSPDKIEIRIGDRIFREGDKVIQTVNDYDKIIFNGEIGEIYSLNTDKEIAILRFEDGDGEKYIEYSFDELRDETDHAYALTVHKAQGSEFDVVLLVMSISHYLFLHRNWFYTAITRAKRVLNLFAHPRAIRIAVKNVKPSKRYTLLNLLSKKLP